MPGEVYLTTHESQQSIILIKKKPPAIFRRGDIVYDATDCDSRREPTRKKLWVWEKIYEPSYEKSTSPQERKMAMSYYVKDGPGEEAKDMGRVSEEDLHDWSPKEELLIEL